MEDIVITCLISIGVLTLGYLITYAVIDIYNKLDNAGHNKSKYILPILLWTLSLAPIFLEYP